MGQCKPQPPAKLFFALMARSAELFAECEKRIEADYGPIDLRTETFSFDPYTDYYSREFGTGLLKRIVALEKLIQTEDLVDVKIRTNNLEFQLSEPIASPALTNSENANRQINIDPGYLNLSKVVLATTKDQAHRLYIARGIFEEITLSYRRVPAGYQPNPWTYPDYRDPVRLDFFGQLRQIYTRQLKGAE